MARVPGYSMALRCSEVALESPPQIRSARVLELFGYWDRIRTGRLAPSWSDVQPGKIAALLPYILAVDVLDQPFDVRYRIVGTAVVDAFGYDFTGETLRQPVRGTDTSQWIAVYREFVERRGPCFAQYRVTVGMTDARIVDVGVFPISDDGLSINRLVELEDWDAEGGFRPGVINPTAQDFAILPPARG
jgi:hypothetical protein